MALKIYNTMSGRKEPFKPRGDRVKMYVCGITPYDDCHIGHARCYVTFDVIRKYLRYKYKEVPVFYVQNFTDIDDKIIQKAKILHRDPFQLADEYITRYYEVMDQLGVERPDETPRVSEHIPEVIHMIKVLMEKGYAYQGGEDVFYAVDKFKSYGKLSHRNLNEMRAGARVERDSRKQSPFDFVLWKEAKPGEPFWNSPWGKGRPGWHIECSVMSMKHLSWTLDIHGGGQDLVFPHHENEIAQSEAYSGQPFVRYWIHNGFVTMNKEKMSKSLGNIYTLKDLFMKYSPEVVRLFLISQHYRSPIDFSLAQLEDSRKMLERFNAVWRTLHHFKLESHAASKERIKSRAASEMDMMKKKFEEAMDDDFNTALALGVLNELATAINVFVSRPSFSEEDHQVLSGMRDVFVSMSGILGLKELSFEKALPDELMDLIDRREKARRRKDYETADRIRRQLGKHGIILEDTPRGTRWRRTR